MKKRQGLTRIDRLERITSVKGVDAIDSGENSLLRRALEVAGFLRYYNLHYASEGHFRELLPQLEELLARLENGENLPEPDGRMEPSQALLYTFIRNLHEVFERFNRRWDDLPHWYIDEVGGIQDLDPLPCSMWVSLEKGTQDRIVIGRETGFVLKSSGVVFHPEEEVVLENITVERIVSVHYKHQRNLYPASALECVTSIEVQEIPNDAESRSTGFIVSSPVLLLREGQRSIQLRLETESHAFTAFIEAANSHTDSPFAGWTNEQITRRLLANIFYVEISTDEGWKEIEGIQTTVGEGHPDNLTIRCALPEEFPATAECKQQLHGIDSRFPAMKVYLNLDAWLYPYSWIREFVLKRIVIDVDVQGVTSLSVYNDLGRVDNSKPFHPFGSGAQKGAWFVIGNYEMAVKHTESLDLHIRWIQLPATSLYEHYRAYNEGIDNRSFRVDAHYLKDYRWHDTPGRASWFLFASDPPNPDGGPLKEAPVTTESTLRGIPVEKMPAYAPGEQQNYDYTIRSKTGFVRFSLTEPEIGFGEKRYLALFSEQLINKVGKKRIADPPEQPIAPLVERITADYRASERIDLRGCDAHPDAGFWHIHPLGIRQVYPNRGHRSVPLIPSLQGELHLIFGLCGVKGGEYLRLWFDFAPMEREMSSYPSVRWFWGDGYNWKELPDDVILCDTTENFSDAGMIGLDIPEILEQGSRDGNGVLWFRATVVSGMRRIPTLRKIVPNAIPLVSQTYDSVGSMPVLLQKPVPGVVQVHRLSPATDCRSRETPTEKIARVSEYTTHRGRVVTPRDYERVVMQAFPEIDYVQCFPNMDTKGSRRGVVTIVAIPSGDRQGKKGWRPKMSSAQILKMEKYLTRRASPAVTQVDVINPRYEEVLIRGIGTFHAGYSTGNCRAMLKELCDRMIAPWQHKRETPRPGIPLCHDEIARTIRDQPYIASLDKLSIIRLGHRGKTGYVIEESGHPGDILYPKEPYAIFVPAQEHLFPPSEEEFFGIGEMAIGQHFIV